MDTGTRIEVTQGHHFNPGTGNAFKVLPGEWGTIRGNSTDGGIYVQWDDHQEKPNSYIFPEQFKSIRREPMNWRDHIEKDIAGEVSVQVVAESLGLHVEKVLEHVKTGNGGHGARYVGGTSGHLIWPEDAETLERMTDKRQTKPTHAHVSLTRLGGVNIKVPVTYKGKSVYLEDPQQPGRIYRISAAKFLAGFEPGDRQSRNDWSIRPWDAHSERTAEAEQNWQT